MSAAGVDFSSSTDERLSFGYQRSYQRSKLSLCFVLHLESCDLRHIPPSKEGSRKPGDLE